MYWDPEVESPASIAVIGAGPVGIEAALYARFLGYDVDLFDTGRPARSATRWNQRLIPATIEECTTRLGHAALGSQDDRYQPPQASRRFTGQQLAEEYLIPLAKSDLLVDGVHINSQVLEVSRRHTSWDEPIDLQGRCNDEFRLLIQSRDRGVYTRRADMVLDCRGAMNQTCGWGPAGSQSIGAAEVLEHVYRWLPGDRRFEIRDVQGRQTILFGQSENARRFAQEWSELVQAKADFDLKLIWLIPGVSADGDKIAIQLATELSDRIDDPKRFSFLQILGIERAVRSEEGRWSLELLQNDDTTVELTGEVFVPLPNQRPTRSIGPELRSFDFAFRDGSHATSTSPSSLFYADWPGWQVATHEPQYYRLGSRERPNDPRGLPEAYRQIRDLFALLGARQNLNLYDIV